MLLSTITTLAGTGTSGYSGDNGLATVAQLSGPWKVAVDSSGDLFIADYANSVVRHVVKSTGKIFTFAGNGTRDYSGDNGQATDAGIGSPSDIAIDALGNVYIADYWNSVVRLVDRASGVITTVAGTGNYGYSGDSGLATLATLASPTGIALDASGNLFIADRDNSVIREVQKSSGQIFTVAGNGTNGYSGDGSDATLAQLRYPIDLAVDSSGNLYIADTSNNVIREVLKSNGQISTIAGVGEWGYSGDGGSALLAHLANPQGVAVDAFGNLIIADCDNHRVRYVTKSSGQVVTLAGDGIAGYTGDGGPAALAELSSPSGVTFDSQGLIVIADTGNNSIRQVSGILHSQTSLVASNPSPAPGESITFTATVSALAQGGNSPTGTVSFLNGSTLIGTASLVLIGGQKQATLTLASMVAGTHSITASYDGDSTFFASTSSSIDFSFGQATTTELSVPPTRGVVGQVSVLTATIRLVGPGGLAPTGTVSFFDDNAAPNARFLGTAPVITTGGVSVASFPLTPTSAGAMALSARYDGDINDRPSTSALLNLDVVQPSVASLSPIESPLFSGDTVTLTATVGPVDNTSLFQPTGTVTFFNGSTVLGTGILETVAGVATASLSLPIGAGSHPITVSYEGDDFSLPTTSPILTVEVAKLATLTRINASTRSFTFGQSTTFTATVAIDAEATAIPSGSVVFKEGIQTLGTATLIPLNGVMTATFSTASLTAGSRTIIASYVGDSETLGSVAVPVVVTVAKVNTTTTLTASQTNLVFGQNLTFTATVGSALPGGPPPTGVVWFKDGTNTIGTATLGLVNGQATASFSTSLLGAGTHSITAVYNPDTNHLTSSTQAMTVAVAKASTVSSLSASTQTTTVGQVVSLTATIAAQPAGSGALTGTVRFFDGTTHIGNGTLRFVNGSATATLSTAALTTGLRSLTVVYDGDTNNEASSSAAASLNVISAPVVVRSARIATIRVKVGNGKRVKTVSQQVIEVSFSGELSGVTNLGAYQLLAGKTTRVQGKPVTTYRTPIALTTATISTDSAGFVVRLTPKAKLAASQRVQFTILAATLSDPYARPLSGNQSGATGGNYVAIL